MGAGGGINALSRDNLDMKDSEFLHNVKGHAPASPSELSPQPETPPNPPNSEDRREAGCSVPSCCASSLLGKSRMLSYDIIHPFVYIVNDDCNYRRPHKKLIWKFGIKTKEGRRLREIALKYNPSQLKPIYPDRSFAAKCSRLLKIPLCQLILADLRNHILSKFCFGSSPK